MSAYAEYFAGLISREELSSAVRQEAWLDDYYEEKYRMELDFEDDYEEEEE